MSVNYSLVQMKNPQKPTEEPKFYAKAQASGTVEINEIAEDVAYATSLTDGDVLNVIRALIKQMKKHMSNGRIVKLETLARFSCRYAVRAQPQRKSSHRRILRRQLFNFAQEH